ncbi:DUF4942 domain-containing protein [Aurantimonas sp. DM33-3]|uniref:DUF4942 domain-containing protein n=1 Tax=Aurantimonas sp. DM33-3 TaxID=2766955 RepID=UPI00165262B6|nr:DUF4942 domain-containing protein [Aurantimonas sp. DM33-3]MBC6714756.1 DUF4942 domain-containing protein [Aurantimonas sp. DM33-3]
MNQMIHRATIDEICSRRDRALELYGDAFIAIADAHEKMMAAHQMVKAAAPGGTAWYDRDAREVQAFYNAVSLPDADQFQRVARRLTDIQIWSHIIERTDLERLMDSEAKKQLRDQMRYVPERSGRDGEIINQEEIDAGLPPVTVENVQATLEGFMAEADFIWRRGIANVFAKLDRRFRSHDGWKIGSRVILDYAFSGFMHYSMSGRQSENLMDIERAFLVLDGKPVPPNYAGIVGQVEYERRGSRGPHQSEHENEYFKIRIFKNGNAHLWMQRKDLVQKVNKILGEYYGEAIGDNENVPQNADPLKTAKTGLAKNYGFFPTPLAVGEKVIEEARLHAAAKATDARVKILEPSAGSGNLARLAAEDIIVDANWEWSEEERERICIPTKVSKPIVDCVEIHNERARDLTMAGRYRKVHHCDFLALNPDVTGLYDRIVMNPPFDRERDIDHVVHALNFLEPDGILVSVMSAGTEFRETKKSQAFRELVEKRGFFQDLPDRSFAECGTNVNTLLCVIGRRKW